MPVSPAPAPATAPRSAGPRPLLILILATLLVLASGPLLAGAAPARAATPSTFPDVPATHTFHEAVTWMIQHGITTGRTDGTFGVDEDISRAQASAFLYRLIDPEHTPPAESPFPDVPEASTWFGPIAWMVQEGIVSGYTDGTFRPDRSISRGEMAKLLYGVADADSPVPGSDPFSDVPADSSYARHIAWMESEGISQGYADGTFRPAQPISRGEAAQLIWKTAGEMGFDTTVFPVSFAVAGSGWGHGVGMSQYGAREMARTDYTVQQILSHYYSPAAMAQAPALAREDISVHLVSTDEITVGGTGDLRVRASGSVQLPQAEAVTFSVEDGHVVASYLDEDGKAEEKHSGSVALEWTGTRFWDEEGAKSLVTVPDARGTTGDLVLRHGRLVVTVNEDGALNVVTQLRMDDEYLYGLDEMPSLWPAAALQAQAVAGRSYALRNMRALKDECDCHVWDETRSQKFTGWAKENEGNGRYGGLWKAAVDDTSMKALYYNGSVAEATYSSSSGGRTRAATEMGWSATPYLTSRADPHSLTDANPNRSWTQSVTQQQMARAFTLANVVTVKETAVNGTSGYTDWMTATASDGTTSRLTGNQFRTQLGLKSAFISSVTPR